MLKLAGRMIVAGTAGLYIALGAGANAHAQSIADLAVGEMAGLMVHETPRAVPEAAIMSDDGAPAALPEGRPTVVNFWATWCAPCREEMPELAALQEAMGDDVAVVLVATGRNDPEAAEAFLAEVGAQDLVDLRDPEGALGRGVGIGGLPTTLILDPEGQEVARLVGIADWASEDAIRLLTVLGGES